MPPSAIALWIGGLLAFLCLLAAFRNGRRRLLIDRLPTSKTTGVLPGLVELKGRAELEGPPLCSHLTHQPCLHYKWLVEEKWSYLTTEDGSVTRERGWQKVAGGEEMAPFQLTDDHGSILVHPNGAKIEPIVMLDVICNRKDPLYYGKGPAKAVSHSKHERRFYEIGIPLHQELYIVGQARKREDIEATEIANDRRAPLFLISAWTEEEVRKRCRGRSVKWTVGGLFVLLAGLLVRDILTFEIIYESWPIYVLNVAAYFFVAMFMRALMIRSARVRQATGLQQSGS